MRCLSLANALAAKGGQVRFVCHRLSGTLAGLVRQAGHELVALADGDAAGQPEDAPHARQGEDREAADARNTMRALSDRSWDWLVVDHYRLSARWESALRACAGRILVIDDFANRIHDCDALLDPGVVAPASSCRERQVPQGCRLLLGPGYALLRDQFARQRASVSVRRGPVRRVLILMGGMDSGNETEKAIRAVARIPQRTFDVEVVVGADHPALAQVRAACDRHGYRCHVQVADVAAVMARVDLAIGGCGSSSWERCCLGLPTIGLTLAENQASIAKGLEERGAIVHLGDAADVSETDLAEALLGLIRDPQQLAALSAAALELTDGKGAERVREFMIGVA